MFGFFKKFFSSNRRGSREIAPDEIFLDSSNLPEFDVYQFEGRIEKPITRRTLYVLGSVFVLVGLLFSSKVWNLQIAEGSLYAERSEDNHLQHSTIFSNRGVIFDRTGYQLAWNVPAEESADFLKREYAPLEGTSHVVGYVKYPSKDTAGFYYTEEFEGKDGVEKFWNNSLTGKNGLKIIETNALGKVQSESVIRPPDDGKSLMLSIDAKVQNKLFEYIRDLANQAGFSGGAGIIMDVETGGILAMTSYPEYSSQILADGKNTKQINKYLASKDNPFLDRTVSGLYTPGSIIKPFVALGALAEKVIDPNTSILSTGSISIPNPYFPDKPSIFNDWKAHGWVDMKQALAVSSDVYFYEVGGGFEKQKGLGIENIEKYTRMFGFGEVPGSGFFLGKKGVIPNPEWKKENFDGDGWRVGDTYFTSIGQYGFLVSPLQSVRAVAAIANSGKLLEPKLLAEEEKIPKFSQISMEESYFRIVRDGMRQAVTVGTAKPLDIPQVTVSAKTGTAELGVSKKFVNSWTVGFFPAENPRYAFAVLMEKGPRTNLIGASFVMRQLLEWMAIYADEYVN